MPARHYTSEISKAASKARQREKEKHFSQDQCPEEEPIKGNIDWDKVREDLGLEPEDATKFAHMVKVRDGYYCERHQKHSPGLAQYCHDCDRGE